MSEKKIVIGSGLSFTTILFLIFLVLKLTETITWSWWWVTAPLWIGPATIIVFLIVSLMLFLLYVFIK